MDFVIVIVQKIAMIAVLMGVGAYVRALKIIDTKNEGQLSKLAIDFLWPAMIIHSIVTQLEHDDIIVNWTLPLFALLTTVTGYCVGLIFVKIGKFTGDRKAVSMYHSTINNFIFMALPFVILFIPGKGMALLFVHNLGIIFGIWTIGVSIFKKQDGIWDIFRNLMTPGFIATVGAILLVFSGVHKYIPSFIIESTGALGDASFALTMLITGAQIHKLGITAVKLDRWNVGLVVVRLILVPAVLLVVAWLLYAYAGVSREIILVFAIVNLMPASLNSVSMAIRFKSSPELAAQGIVSTTLVSSVTIVAFLIAYKYMFAG